MHAMLIDENGKAALVHLKNVQPNLYRYCVGIKIYETGEIIKEPVKYKITFPTTAPIGRAITACTKYGLQTFGADALVWTIGVEADNGFSVPPADTIDKMYIRVAPAIVKEAESPRKYVVIREYITDVLAATTSLGKDETDEDEED